MIKSISALLAILMISGPSFSEQSPFGNSDRKSKEEYKNSQCVNLSTKYREKLTYEEVCKYGESCPIQKSTKKFTMYCISSNLSECFENKSWKSSNQLVGIADNIKVGLVTQGLSFKNGVNTGKTCAYYD